MAPDAIGRALLKACTQGSLPEATLHAQRLLAHGISRQSAPPFKLAMAKAAYQGHTDILRSLINEHIQQKTALPSSPWEPRIPGGSQGEDIPQEWGASRMLDLVVYQAAAGGKPGVMQTLIDFGLTPDHEIDKMGSPLSIAIRCEKVDLVRFLLERGADPDGMYWIPADSFLNRAGGLSSPDILKALLDHGAKVAGSRALQGAAENGRIDSAKMLLEHGADVNEVFDLELWHDEKDNLGTALHVAVKHKQKEFVKLLLASGARRDLKDGDGRTPQEVALTEDDEYMVQLLQ